MSAVAAVWDLAVRGWLIAAAWYGLRRPARLRWLASIGHPRRLLRAAIVPAGRHFALAIAFLPRARRDEATVTFLICKALDAFEDLSADRAAARAGLTAAADYLVGRAEHPPHGDRLIAARESDRVEALLAARLPLLRIALEALPADAVARGRALIDRIAGGMLRGQSDRRSYADDVLGEAVGFAAEIAAPAVPPPRAACRAAGRVLQLANDLRDAGTARERQIALYQALPELPIVPRLLRWLPASAGPGARAAATLIAITTCAFYLRHVPRPGAQSPPPRLRRPIHAHVPRPGLQSPPPRLRHPIHADVPRPGLQSPPPRLRHPIHADVPRPGLQSPPPRLRHPIRAALASAGSHRAYLATVDAIEGVLRDALAAVAGVPADALARTSPTDAAPAVAGVPADALARTSPTDAAPVAFASTACEIAPRASGGEIAAQRVQRENAVDRAVAPGNDLSEFASERDCADATDCVASAEVLLALAMQLIHAVPHARLEAAAGGQEPGTPIVLADYLLFAAVDRLAELGPGSVARVAALLEQLAAPTDRAELVRSTALAEFAREVG